MDISKWEPGVVSNPFSGALSDPLVLGAKPRSAKFAGQIVPLETTSNWAGSAPPKHCRTAKANHKFITKPERNEKRCQKNARKNSQNRRKPQFPRAMRTSCKYCLVNHIARPFPQRSCLDIDSQGFLEWKWSCYPILHVLFGKSRCAALSETKLLRDWFARFPWMEMKLFPHFARIVW